MGFSIHSVCMLGNRTISGHEIDDNQCAKTILLPIKEPAEAVDANFTIINGTNVSHSHQLGWGRFKHS